MADLKGNRPDGRKNKKGKLSKVEKKKMMREAKKKLAKVNRYLYFSRNQICNMKLMMNRYVRRTALRAENEERLIFSLMLVPCLIFLGSSEH